MPTLIGPTYEQNVWSRHPFWGRYKDVWGITLLVKGAAVTQTTYPWQGDLWPGGDTSPDWDYVYLGGHTYKITQAQADVLIAAGYGAYVFPGDPPGLP